MALIIEPGTILELKDGREAKVERVNPDHALVVAIDNRYQTTVARADVKRTIGWEDPEDN